MATWPATLPQSPLQSGFQDAEPDLVIHDQMDAGPPILRRKDTAEVRPFTWTQWLTASQKSTLRTFYRSYCASSFDFPDPDTGATISVIFTKPPSYGEASGLYQKVTLQLGEMP
ncbi:MAG: hypothetical protein M1438_09370 [Deltaproteobacteria bacterium]|nr:hypothetical protein [Deltaproteobacteria bacterium]